MEDKIKISNFLVAFIDLLGQREALKGQAILPVEKTKDSEEKFYNSVIQSIGTIDRLQKQAEFFYKGKSNIVSIREHLSEEEKTLYDEMKKVKAKQQRWSDGLVYYTSLETETVNCPMHAVLDIFMLAGTLCFLGLSNSQPIRGGIEVSWGVELHDNEIYGAAVANSYKIESEIAQYPRIVIGKVAMMYLNSYLLEPPDTKNKLALYNRNCAQLCLNMTAIDQDGHYIIDYLGETFTECVSNKSRETLIKLSYSYICEQYEKFKTQQNTKLCLRYTWLRGYFHNNMK